MIHGQVGFFKYRSQFELGRRNFIMSGFSRNAEFKELFFYIVHIRRHSFLDAAEILIFQLLTFSRGRAYNSTAAKYEILPFEEIIHIN